MKLRRPVSILLPFSLASNPMLTAKLLFTDTFNQADGSETEDALGNGWTTNSAWRSDGDKKYSWRTDTSLSHVWNKRITRFP